MTLDRLVSQVLMDSPDRLGMLETMVRLVQEVKSDLLVRLDFPDNLDSPVE